MHLFPLANLGENVKPLFDTFKDFFRLLLNLQNIYTNIFSCHKILLRFNVFWEVIKSEDWQS